MAQAFASRLVFAVGLGIAASMTGCGTTHPLPPYERPLARTEFQVVRTTAYTHTESDHLTYGNRNALGGTLHAASTPVRADSAYAVAAIPVSNPADIVDEQGGFHRAPLAPRIISPSGGGRAESVFYGGGVALTVVGSAAADWSRWPAGTMFRIESTGQVYQVDDYGWALAGRNTIDLYESTRGVMNAWGVRRVAIHILRWGDREESLRRLRGHQKYRHIRRMVLELEGRQRAAANLD